MTNKFITLILYGILLSHSWGGIHFYARDAVGNLGVVRWPHIPITVEINASTSDSLSNAEVLEEINFALDQWETIPTSSITFQRITTFISESELGGEPDFRNFISFGSGNFNPGIIALTFVTSDTALKEIVDADIQFNKGEFRFLTEAQGPSDPDNGRIVLRNVATHELGHFLGFDHSPLKELTFDIFTMPESTMFPFFSDKQGSLEQDDISILSFTYPSSSSDYTGSIEGVVLNGDFASDASLGAHVIAWDHLNNPNVAVSSISGLSTTGANLNAYYKIEGLPPGNYKILIEPFPILSDRGTVQIDQDFDFLNQVSSSFKNSFLFKTRTFPTEFWHGNSESTFEISTGFSDAEQVVIDTSAQNASQRVDFFTNSTNTDLNLSNSILETEREILYANGVSSSKLRLLIRDAISNPIPTDLSSRLEFRLTTGSFSSTSVLTRTTPAFQNDGSFTYVAEVFSTTLPNAVSRVVSFISLHRDNQSTPVFNTPLEIAFEKADPVRSTVLFLPNPEKYDEDGIEQARTDIFADGQTPATFRIIPKFSNEEIILDPIPLNSTITFISVDPLEPSITTFPVVSLSGNQYQTTLTNSLPGVVQPIISLDSVLLTEQDSIRFSGVSTTQSRFTLDANTIHIQHPLIETTPVARVQIEPALADGSVIKTPLPTNVFNIVLLDQSGNPSAVQASAVTGPLFDQSNNLFYQSQISAGQNIEEFQVRVEIFSRAIAQTQTLAFSVSDPTKTQIRAQKEYLLRGSSQKSVIEVIPRFSDNTLVNLDLSELIFLSTTLGNLNGKNGSQSSTAVPAISPSFQGSGILTAVLSPGNQNGDAFVSGRIQSLGFQDIEQQAIVRIASGNANLLLVNLADEVIPADAKTVTTMTVTPLFPNSTPIGKEFPEDSLKASITAGEFLKKTPSIGNPDIFVLVAAGRDGVSFFNNENGTFELSIRSTGFSTNAEIRFEVDDVLSLITENISFSASGSADPEKTLIEIENPFLFANGTTRTRIDIFPRSPTGESIILPETSSVLLKTTEGTLVGSLIKNPDFSFSQHIESISTTLRTTALVTVLIDGIEMTPPEEIKITFLNLDVSTLAPEVGIPDQGLVDGFDISILSRAIRNRWCSNSLGDCRFDFNQDGEVNILDLDIVEQAYGKQAP